MDAKSNGYWITQIAASALFGIGLPILGVWMFDLKPDEPGMGLIMILIGLAFLGCLIWLLRAFFSMSKKQRAIYAWAIGQQTSGSSRSVGSDAEAMSIAAKAKDGTLSPDELKALQALRPEVPYPGA